MLSFVAGSVNIAGLSAVNRLTTNVTGHFAFLADEVANENMRLAFVYVIFIGAFLLGAFFSGLLTEALERWNERYVNIVPVVIEISILVAVAFSATTADSRNADSVAAWLLFAMGLQNALVTSISNAVVRTTHLTGLFTDLGIELSQLFFYRKVDERKKLTSSIKLRLVIIASFFVGGIAGGFGFRIFGLKILLFSAAVLTIALVYDYVRVNLILIKRRITS